MPPPQIPPKGVRAREQQSGSEDGRDPPPPRGAEAHQGAVDLPPRTTSKKILRLTKKEENLFFRVTLMLIPSYITHAVSFHYFAPFYNFFLQISSVINKKVVYLTEGRELGRETQCGRCCWRPNLLARVKEGTRSKQARRER